MSNEERAFLSLPRYPAYLCLLEVCWLLGLKYHQGKILVTKGLIIPAGKRRRRKGRLFKTAYILELADDQDWLDKAKDALSLHWEKVNAAKAERAKQKAISPTSGPRLTTPGSKSLKPKRGRMSLAITDTL